MLTLFLGFSKRRAELGALERPADVAADAREVAQRPVLASYSTAMLDRMVATTAAGAATGYALYTVDPDTVLLHGTNGLILTLPFVVYRLFRYLFLVHRRGGGRRPGLGAAARPAPHRGDDRLVRADLRRAGGVKSARCQVPGLWSPS